MLGCGGGGPEPRDTTAHPPTATAPPLVAPGTWVVLGSSTALGVGASQGAGWVARLATAQAARQVTVQNLSKAGASTFAALSANRAAIPNRPVPDLTANVDRALALQPRLLLLSYPTNDTAAGYGAEETVNNLLALRQAAAAGGATTMVLGSQPRDAFNAGQNDKLQAIDEALAQQLGPCFVPLRAALADAQGRIAPRYSEGDGIHLNDAGHARVAQQVQAVLDGGRCVRLLAN